MRCTSINRRKKTVRGTYNITLCARYVECSGGAIVRPTWMTTRWCCRRYAVPPMPYQSYEVREFTVCQVVSTGSSSYSTYSVWLGVVDVGVRSILSLSGCSACCMRVLAIPTEYSTKTWYPAVGWADRENTRSIGIILRSYI